MCSSQNENILYTSKGLHKARNDYDFENQIFECLKKLLIIRAIFAQLKWELNRPRGEIMEEISEIFELRRVVLRI